MFQNKLKERLTSTLSSRFVQYNQLSQDLAFDSRLVDTIKELTKVPGASESTNETIEATIAAVRDLVEESEFARDGRNSLGTSCSDLNIECDDDVYRSIDGLCNNLAQADWGAAGRKLLRYGKIIQFARKKYLNSSDP